MSLILASKIDKRTNAKEIAGVLGKKEFYIKNLLGKKISKNRATLLLSLVVDSLVSLETSQGDSLGSFLMSLYTGLEKGI